MLEPAAAWVGIECQVHLPAAIMRISDPFLELRVAEIQAWEGAGIGLITKSCIHRVRSGINGCLQRRQVSRRAYEFHGQSPSISLLIFDQRGSRLRLGSWVLATL